MDSLKVVAINGSPKERGNCSTLLEQVLKPIKAASIEVEVVQLGGQPIHGCKGCLACTKMQNRKCIITDDPINDTIEKIVAADGIILASPTYFADLTAELKAFIDRAGYVCLTNGNLLRRKIGAAVVSVRRAGSIHVLNSIQHFFLINEMVVPGSSYWNMGYGLRPGDVENDSEGMRTMDTLGENMVWLLKELHLPQPAKEVTKSSH